MNCKCGKNPEVQVDGAVLCGDCVEVQNNFLLPKGRDPMAQRIELIKQGIEEQEQLEKKYREQGEHDPLIFTQGRASGLRIALYYLTKYVL